LVLSFRVEEGDAGDCGPPREMAIVVPMCAITPAAHPRHDRSGIVLPASKEFSGLVNRYRPNVTFPLNIMMGTYYIPQVNGPVA
jgi:hypothetical protein